MLPWVTREGSDVSLSEGIGLRGPDGTYRGGSVEHRSGTGRPFYGVVSTMTVGPLGPDTLVEKKGGIFANLVRFSNFELLLTLLRFLFQ